MVNKFLVLIIIEELGLMKTNIDKIYEKLNQRMELLNKIYHIPLKLFFTFMNILNLLLFFIPTQTMYKYSFKLFSYIGGPFNLLTKLLKSYIVLDYFEELKND